MPFGGRSGARRAGDGNGATPSRQRERPARGGFTAGFMQKFEGGENKFAPEIQLSAR